MYQNRRVVINTILDSANIKNEICFLTPPLTRKKNGRNGTQELF